jgi:DNA polymerase III delta prime subunit|tara:strand:- start:990 stop:1889 length:900 start_codon:yes stop_codon:yes gene_type:complete
MHTIWTEKYRPTDLSDYIGNDSIKGKVRVYLESGEIPHLLLYGKAGTGKTTLAKLIIKNIECDYIYINASDENNVDTVRTKVRDFSSSVGFTPLKVVILDEADYMTPNAQAALRNLMETFSKHTRFILTCNYVEKIIDPIQSRCQVFGVTPPSRKDVAERLLYITSQENILEDKEAIVQIVNATYPDIRRSINALQRQIIDHTIVVDEQSLLEAEYVTKILDELTGGKSFTSIRKIVANSQVKNFEDLYRYLFENVDEYAKDVAACILILAESQYQSAFSVDKEINIMGMFYKLLQETK